MAICFIFFANDNTNSWREEKVNLKINNQVYQNVLVDKMKQPPVKKGDIVTISKKLSSDDENIAIRTYGSTVDIYIDGENVYSYGNSLYEKGEMLGRGYHIARFENAAKQNKSILIKIKPAEYMSYAWIDFLKFTPSDAVWQDIFINDSFGTMTSVILFAIGAIGYTCVILVCMLRKKSNEHLLYAFAIAFFVGVWNCCIHGVLQFITKNLELVSFLEYFSLYCSALFYVYVIEIIKKNTKFRKTLNFMKWTYSIFLIVVLFLHFSKILLISQTVSVFRFFIISVSIVFLFILFSDYLKQKKHEKILLLGSIISLFMFFLQAVFYNFNYMKISIMGRVFVISDAPLDIAILIVVILPLLTYIVKVEEIESYEIQINLLKEIAYLDNLTGLGNRHSGMAFVMELIRDSLDYSIILFDINNLKTANDNYGHSRGDELILRFANCLKSVFTGDDFSKIRYGGDEFVVIIKAKSEKEVYKYVENLMKLIDEDNKGKKEEYFLSVAYGIASSREINDCNYERLIKLADKRMYENKDLKKASEKIG